VYQVILPRGGNTVGHVKADLRLRHRFPNDAPLEIVLRGGIPLDDGQVLQDGAGPLELHMPSAVVEKLRLTVAPVTSSGSLSRKLPTRGAGGRGGDRGSRCLCCCAASKERGEHIVRREQTLRREAGARLTAAHEARCEATVRV
jgi:hypothetical protein